MRWGIWLSIALVSGCVFDLGNGTEPFTVSLVGDDSLLDVYKPLRIAFSKRLASSATAPGVQLFEWSPPFFQFKDTVCESRDTVVLKLSEDLSYNTTYLLRPTPGLTSEDGERLEDTLVVKTLPGEMEPNNDAWNADTLALDVAYGGAIDPRLDIDWFFVDGAAMHDSLRFILSRLTTSIDLEIRDTSGTTVYVLSKNRGFRPDTLADTLTLLPDAACCAVKVLAQMPAEAAGHYRLQVFRKP